MGSSIHGSSTTLHNVSVFTSKYAVAQLVEVTSRKVASSIPDGVNGMFHWPNPSGRNTYPRWTQPLTETSTRYFPSGVKAAGA